jgi:hypothetical protein
MAGDEPVDAAEYCVLLVDRGAEAVAGGGDGRQARIAAETDDGGGLQAAEERARGEIARHEAERADEAAQEAAGHPADRQAVRVERAEAPAIARPPVVGHEGEAEAARGERSRQRFRREHVAAGTAGREDHERRAHSVSPAPKRLRLSASTKPMPSAIASSDEPP